jgi:hypothetical protein
LRSEDRDNHLSLPCRVISRYSCLERPRKFPHGSVLLRWPSCGLTLLPLHYSDPTYRITRDTQFPIPVTKLIIQAARHTRSFIKSHRICLDKGWNPCPWSASPTPARWPTGFCQLGKCTRVMRYFGAIAESAHGEEEKETRMESAAALIGSQPCDVFIAFLVYCQGQVTIGLVLVNSGGCTSGWWLALHVATSFLSFCWGWGGRRRVRTIPSYLPLLNRHYGRNAISRTCMDTSYNGRDPVTNAPDLGSGDGQHRVGRLTDRI